MEWVFSICGWNVALAGVVLAWRWGWRDPGKGTRRCPECWYDMRATAGVKCPECGREAKGERALFRKHRKWGWIACGLAIAALSYPVVKWPLYQRAGWVGFVPRAATIWLITELPDSWARWKTATSPRQIMLLDEVCRVRPLDRIERYALAKMYCRVLREPKRYRREFELLWLWQRHLGDQAAVVGPDLAAALAQSEQAQFLVSFAVRLPPVLDTRMAGVVKPLIRTAMDGQSRLSQADDLLDRLKLWGASDDELRAVAFHLIDHRDAVQYPDSRAVEFLWRENLVRPEDAERVSRWALVQVWEFATYATFLACEIPESLPALLPALDKTMQIDSLQQIPDWMCLAAAMRGDGAPLLPAFERMSRLKRYPSYAACSNIAILAIQGRPREAYRMWWESLQHASNTDATKHVQRYQVARVVLFLDIPVEMKVEGLIEVLRLEQDDGGGGAGVNGGMLVAIDSLGKLGPAAHSAVGQLCAMIEPGSQSFLVERLLRTIKKIGPLSHTELQALQRTMDEWSRSVASTGDAFIYFEHLERGRKD